MKSLSPLRRYRLRQVVLITIAWTLFGVFLEIYNSISFDPINRVYFTSFPLGETPFQHLLITAVGPFVGGFLGGSLIIFILRERLQKRSFGWKLFLQSVTFFMLIVVLIMLVGSIHAWTKGPDEFQPTFVSVVFNLRVYRLVVIWFVVAVLTLLVLDVSEKYGQGVLWKIIIGKYHQPSSEERIFMFMDLTDSTRLTESLGDARYFQLLSKLYLLATEPVLNSEGEIYQYVGDEIVVSWTVSEGLRNANCIQCYLRISDTIEKHKHEFLKQFGTLPAFKAAVHMGSVMIGEIGVIKKDIVYSGDVLNSTARILGLSRQYGEQLLVSDVIYEQLKADRRFVFQFLDALVLRGKTVESRIYGVRQAERYRRSEEVKM